MGSKHLSPYFAFTFIAYNVLHFPQNWVVDTSCLRRNAFPEKTPPTLEIGFNILFTFWISRFTEIHDPCKGEFSTYFFTLIRLNFVFDFRTNTFMKCNGVLVMQIVITTHSHRKLFLTKRSRQRNGNG